MLALGFLCCYVALAVGLTAAFRSSTPRLPLDRRRPAVQEPASALSRITGLTAGAIDRFLTRRGWMRAVTQALEYAGVKMPPAHFLILTGSATLIAGMLGLLLSGPVLALLPVLVVPLGGKLLLRVLTAKRQRAFADQLDDALQLLAGGLRAGHSLLRALDAVSQEADSPTAEEFARVINETRLGRDLNDALDQTARRMKSEDFGWVAQAIGIHREVGGDLAEVLDRVGQTIRERNQIRRQVKSLSAEGKMSAYVLMALPFAVVGILAVTSPSYIAQFGQSVAGYGMIAVSAVMLTLGGLWLRKIVSFKF
ncbi:type II secretion system protein F [Arthrobacter sp. E918]|uniref:Type II secretion system protein F n=1 Tax=Arthrobacter mobilis TaxID=2724944 RepID=A0A7X6QMH6_9MICC|nr:type II secretion system protein F [Arthrobacter mobilis]